MQLTDNISAKVIVGDIETLYCLFDAGFYDRDTNKWFEFEISEYRNDLYSFIKFYNSKEYDYVCGYNYNRFDAQVIQYIIENYHNWSKLTNLEIVKKIYEFVQKLIDDSNYSIFLPFKEEDFSMKTLDVFTILGLDNEVRMSSLKKCAFQLDMDVEEMPIHHGVQSLTKEEILEVKSYRRNDVIVTNKILDLVLGNTDHPIYKDNNQLELRFNIEEEFGLKCLNYSDIKIGDELMKLRYSKEKNIKIWDLPKKGTFRKKVDLWRCIPKYIKFETELLQNLLKDIKNTHLGRKDKWERKFKIGNTNYVQALGGLHSVNSGEKYIATTSTKIKTIDVSLTNRRN